MITLNGYKIQDISGQITIKEEQSEIKKGPLTSILASATYIPVISASIKITIPANSPNVKMFGGPVSELKSQELIINLPQSKTQVEGFGSLLT